MINTIGIILAVLLVMCNPCFGGDSMNLDPGEMRMDMGVGDSMNLDTDEMRMDMGDGDSMNLDTDEMRINIDD